MKKVAIVSPCHIQPSEAWVAALQAQTNHADVIIVDDSDGKLSFPENFDVYGYARQKEALGSELYTLFEGFHKSAACKQFGLWRAYQMGYEVVIVIDSDCIVSDSFVLQHLDAHQCIGKGWENPLEGTGWYSRGFPYSMRDQKLWAHMGLWDNEWDLYGTDRLKKPFTPGPAPVGKLNTPAGFIPLSGMNVSFTREAIPYMLFLPNFTTDEGEFFTRHDDIWGGYVFQKIMKAHGAALSYGGPNVFHDTVVVPQEDADAEVPMIKYEDDFYWFINQMFDLRPRLKDATVSDVFLHLATANTPGKFSNLQEAFLFQSKAYANV